jgi:hypothetical protein
MASSAYHDLQIREERMAAINLIDETNRRTEVRGDTPQADQNLFGYAFVMLAMGDAVGVIFLLRILAYFFHPTP